MGKPVDSLSTRWRDDVARLTREHGEMVALLKQCVAAISDEVSANGDSLDHPMMRAHAKTLDKARALLARIEDTGGDNG